MSNFSISKIVSSLPTTLSANTIYIVRVGTGYDQYVTNTSGTIVAYQSNAAASLAGKEPTITAGTTSQFWQGDKTWVDFATTVRASVLTGVVTTTNTAIAATDTLLVGLGKLQAQINNRLLTTDTAAAATKLATARTINGVAFDGTANITVADATKEPAIAVGTTAQFLRGDKTWVDFATTVRSAVLTGLDLTTSTAVTATDTALTAIGKLQAQITASGSGTVRAGGVNLMEDLYSFFIPSRGAPTLGDISGLTASVVAQTESISQGALRLTVTAANTSPYVTLAPAGDTASLNIDTQPGTYLISMYVYGSVANSMDMFLASSDVYYTVASQAITTTRTRKTFEITIPSNAAVGKRCLVIEPNLSSAAVGSTITIDSIMVELKGSTSTPSVYVPGNSARSLNVLSGTIPATATAATNTALQAIGLAGDGVAMSSTASWDTFTTPGEYFTTGSTGTNAPVSGVSFALKVIKYTTLVKQTATLGTSAVSYSRYYNGTVWSAWSRTADITEAVPLNKNLLINGNFDVWQRGTTQTATAYGSDDRWSNNNTGTTKTHSQQAFVIGQTFVPTGAKYFSRTVVTSVAGSTNFCIKGQAIEDVNILQGRTATLSFYAKSDAARNMAFEFVQNFGITGGSANVTAIGSTSVALTTAWTKYTYTIAFPSSSGKTVTAGSYTCLYFWFDAGASYSAARAASVGQQSGTFDIASVKLELGSVATAWEPRTYIEEENLCKRYYWRHTSTATSEDIGASGFAFNTTTVHNVIRYPQKMRIIPAIGQSGLAAYSGAGTAYNITSINVSVAGVESAGINTAIGTASFTVGQGTTLLIPTIGGYLYADAEFGI